MRILLSGASGFVGSALFTHLQSKQYQVVRLVREPNLPNSICWDPEKGRLVKEAFEGFDAVVHLAGENISSRWNQEKKKAILFSRTVGTFLLSTVLAQLYHPPKVFISASAVGFYGDRGDEILTEKSGAGRGFLANVCCEWEKATHPIAERGSRCVQTRFGMVIGPGGALKKMMLPYRLGLGGPIGSGEQWISWVDRSDLVRAIDFCLTSDLEGPINVVSPNCIRQKEFSRVLGSALHRPAILRQPAWMLRLLFGQMADEVLLASQRVEPAQLIRADFSFHTPQLDVALQKAIEELDSRN